MPLSFPCSWGAKTLALGVCSSTDPAAGFFATTRTIFAKGDKDINPIGWKIGLETAVRCRAKVTDVPIIFQEREEGESK